MRILIVKLGAVGDVVMASTALIPLRQQHEDAHITWLVGDRIAPLLRRFEEIDEVLEVDAQRLLAGSKAARIGALSRVLLSLAGRSFDLVVTAHPDWRYRTLTSSVRAGSRRWLSHGLGRRRFLPGRHHCDEYVRLFTGLDGPNAPLPVFPEVAAELPSRLADRLSSARGPFAVLSPGGARNLLRSDALRRWPVQHYAELARQLLADGVDCALVGDSNDDWTREHFEGLGVIDLIGETDLTELLAVCRAASVVVTHDSGVLHIGRLAGTPQVALFGPTMPLRVGPQQRHLRSSGRVAPRAISIWGGEALACRPCYDGRDYASCQDNLCLREISAREVHRAALELLRGERSPEGSSEQRLVQS